MHKLACSSHARSCSTRGPLQLQPTDKVWPSLQVEHTPQVHKRVLDILPGVSGGVARIMVGQPFDTIKTRLQASQLDAQQHCRLASLQKSSVSPAGNTGALLP
eukprot:GHRQ01010728.1.p1 GENE.GHRQ01010728.1~~GHRQ01010728.1.p1  ORF type:complete len:103 (-),score=30.55 GHRQ01010728.1:1317-1625(-)